MLGLEMFEAKERADPETDEKAGALIITHFFETDGMQGFALIEEAQVLMKKRTVGARRSLQGGFALAALPRRNSFGLPFANGWLSRFSVCGRLRR